MKNLSQHLKGLSTGLFINDTQEYCRVTTYYEKNKMVIMIYFQKDYEVAYAPAIKTTSVNKVESILNASNFVNVNN